MREVAVTIRGPELRQPNDSAETELEGGVGTKAPQAAGTGLELAWEARWKSPTGTEGAAEQLGEELRDGEFALGGRSSRVLGRGPKSRVKSGPWEVAGARLSRGLAGRCGVGLTALCSGLQAHDEE